jgi:heterodisulfide reductase subunit A
MTCAYFSALLGHDVTVFESSPTLGGMPRIGIPDFRLPKDVVDREVGQILEAGVRARTNTTVGRDIEFDKILADFDACLVAVGTWKERCLDVPGVDSSLSGLSFLRQVNLGHRDRIGDRVVIIGGGGVAFDCAFTAKRLGASEVHVVCVEDKGNLCASAEDVPSGSRRDPDPRF